jgi:hypothetical protein
MSNFNIQVSDMLGRTLSAKEIRNASNEVLEFNLSGYDKGVYFIIVQNEKQKSVLKAIHK